jgi:hypothetical protein
MLHLFDLAMLVALGGLPGMPLNRSTEGVPH